MKKIIIVGMLIAMISNVNAGVYTFTMHSRANCGNNESISWQRGVYRTLGTVSHHYKNNVFMHAVNTGWEYTWRSAAVHWGEAGPGSGWRVIGYHWIMEANQAKLLDYTESVDCSQYDGWW